MCQLLCAPQLLDLAPGLRSSQPLAWRSALAGLADAGAADVSRQLPDDVPGGRAAAAASLLGNLTQMAPSALRVSRDNGCPYSACVCTSPECMFGGPPATVAVQAVDVHITRQTALERLKIQHAITLGCLLA